MHNPTTLDPHTFVDYIPLVRAIIFGVKDTYPKAHYPQVLSAANLPSKENPDCEPHPIFALCKHEAHAPFKHPRYASPPDSETTAELEIRDQEHRVDALEAIPPEIAAAFAKLSAKDAELQGLCPEVFWENASDRLGVQSMLEARGCGCANQG
jgi:hypothetical protein